MLNGTKHDKYNAGFNAGQSAVCMEENSRAAVACYSQALTPG